MKVRLFLMAILTMTAMHARAASDTDLDSLIKMLLEQGASPAVNIAKRVLGTPYRWGGTSAKSGFDCSGLTGAVYRLNGLRLPRSSQAQFEAGTPVEVDRARPGDLLFFATKAAGRVSHVGLYLGKGTFLHAPSPGRAIRQDELADPYFRKALLGARTYL